MAINRAKHRRTRFAPPPPDEDPSPAQVDIYIRTYAEDLSEYEARKAAGITRAQLARLKDDPAFLRRLVDLKEDIVDRVEDAAYRRAIQFGDKDLIKLILASKRQQEYGARQQVEINVNLKTASDEELEAIVQGKKR